MKDLQGPKYAGQVTRGIRSIYKGLVTWAIKYARGTGGRVYKRLVTRGWDLQPVQEATEGVVISVWACGRVGGRA